MFDNFSDQPGSAGFLPDNRSRRKPQFERLESREVPAVIGGVVYDDANCNGLFDSGEVGISGVSLQLVNSSTNQVVATTRSTSSGQYQFTALGNAQPGPGVITKTVEFSQSRTNHVRTLTLDKFNPAMGTLTSIEITATGSLNSSIQMENLEEGPATAEAQLHGNFRFQVGSSVLQSSPERDVPITFSSGFDGTADFAGASSSNPGTVSLAGTFSRLLLNNPADMAAFIGSGTINVSENATMESCACGTGNLLSMIRTTAGGAVTVKYNYTSNGSIPPGDYIVRETQPGGYFDGFDTNDNITVIANSNHTDSINVHISEFSDQSNNNNFGEAKPASVSGKVYADRNNSGVFDQGDRGIPSVLVLLMDETGTHELRRARTDANGNYKFAGLAVGTYVIREIQPAGYQQGTNSPGQNPTGTLSGTDDITVELCSGMNGTDYNFGEIGGNSITTPPTTPTPPITPSKWFFILGRTGIAGW